MSEGMHAYAFEAKAIQNYILDGGRLRDVVGGSALVEALCSEPVGTATKSPSSLLEATTRQVDGMAAARFTRKAGGAFVFIVESEEVVKAFRSLWTLVVQCVAPGLEFVDAVASGKDDLDVLEALYAMLPAQRSRLRVKTPGATPIMMIAPRTGGAACAKDESDLGGNKRHHDEDHYELLDRPGEEKRRWRNADNLVKKFSPEVAADCWPVNMESEPNPKSGGFPFLNNDEAKYIALVHADGNRMGQILIAILETLRANKSDSLQEALSTFSTMIDEVTVTAAQIATTKHLVGNKKAGEMIPARPIVLGGDDMSIIIRGDLALDFTETFLKEFQRLAKSKLDNFCVDYKIPKQSVPELTACAGVAFFKHNQPFALGMELAESLCAYAKGKGKLGRKKTDRVPSCVAFHRNTGSQFGQYKDIVKDDLSLSGLTLTMQPYGVQGDEFPSLGALRSLKTYLQNPKLSGGPLRNFIDSLRHTPEKAGADYKRWCTVMGKRNPTLFERYEGALALLVGSAKQYRTNAGTNHHGETPIFDALSWKAVEGKAPQAADEMEAGNG